MTLKIQFTSSPDSQGHMLVTYADQQQLDFLQMTAEEKAFVERSENADQKLIEINRYKRFIWLCKTEESVDNTHLEAIRQLGSSVSSKANTHKFESLHILDAQNRSGVALAIAEGLALTQYQFLKYFKEADKKRNSLKNIILSGESLSEKDAKNLQGIVAGVFAARTLVNEPLSFLTAEQLSVEIQNLGNQSGFTVDVLNRKQIESLKMGGLLAVNKGSIDPPTFNILSWAPENAINEKPVILVGKGIVYDTGGLSLKPTPNSMDFMKSDMGGAAAVIGTLHAIALQELPIKVIGLIPATDNRPGGNAYAPGDVISMFDKTTVEVLNTDAEGRLVLADALTYAQKYEPELVVDLATLTGAAAAAIGPQGIVAMGPVEEGLHSSLSESGYAVHERLAWMPFWDEYAKDLKSDIADLKNLGSKYAGAITAGKFLEHFTKNADGKAAYPWVHLDIAGTAFLHGADTYRSKGGTGTGVRLLVDFLKNRTK